MTIIKFVLGFFGNKLLQLGCDRFGSWIATRGLPFHCWLRERALKQLHASLEDMSIEGKTWPSFHDSITKRLEDEGISSVLALCGNKQCELADRRLYYDLFYAWSAKCAGVVRVCRIFVQNNADGFGAEVQADIDTHRTHDGVFALTLGHGNLAGIEKRFPQVREQLRMGFGLVVFCYENGKRIVVSHEGSKQTDFAVLEDPVNCKEVLVLYLHLCGLSEELNRDRTRLVQEAVKDLCKGAR